MYSLSWGYNGYGQLGLGIASNVGDGVGFKMTALNYILFKDTVTIIGVFFILYIL